MKDKNSFYRFEEVWKQVESSELTDYINDTKSDLTDYINETKNNLTDSINTTRTDFTNTINSTRDALEKSISDTDAKLDKKIDDTDAKLDKKIDDTKSELTNTINTTKQELTQTINTTTTQLTQSINTTKTDLTNTINTTKDALNKSISDTKTELTTALNTTETDLEKLVSDTEKLNQDLKSVKSTADNAYNGMTDNSGRLTSVETEVQNIKKDYLTSDDYQSLENAVGEVFDIANTAVHNLTTATLLVGNWDEETLTQTVTINGILADTTKQVVNVKPYEVVNNLIAKIDDSITSITLAENTLTFKVSSLPSSEMKFFVEFYPINYIVEIIPEPPAEPEEPETISFYLPNGYEFTGEEGMTWEEWVNSEYNTYNAYIQDNEVWFNQFPAPEGQLELPASGKLVDVVASDVIIAEQTYNYE